MNKLKTPERIEIQDINNLKPSPGNPRTHSREQIQELATSMTAWGFMSAVVADSDGMILAGHARVLAARQLGLTKVPVILVDHLTAAEKRAFSIADNQIALHAGWDNELLKIQLDELKKENIDLSLVGFSQDEFNILADQIAAGLHAEVEDVAPAKPEVPVTRPGDMWQLGGHRMLCGDSTVPETYSMLLADSVANMVFTDPPYNVNYHAPLSPDGQERHSEIINDSLGKHFAVMLQEACRYMIAHVRGALYICMSSSELHTLHSAFVSSGGHWSTFIIWAKNTFTLGRSDYHRQFEPILYGWPEGAPHHWCGARDQGDLWNFDKPHANNLHPTMKPVALVERAILNSSKRGGSVLDPFSGSGTTLIACEKTERVARLLEIEPAYCDVTIARWQELSGHQAVLESTGATFDQTSEERRLAA